MKVFCLTFAGNDLLTLTREELIQICGLSDGIRLNNALQVKTVRPRLTLYVNIQSESGKRFTAQVACLVLAINLLLLKWLRVTWT